MNPSYTRADAAPDRRRPTVNRGNNRRTILRNPEALLDGSSSLQEPAAGVRQATRLLSETAHDLRSPLTTIRESVRLVRDGGSGLVADDQRSLLTTAIDQCDCLDQLVEELVQFDRLRHGALRVRREWVSIQDVRRSVDETLRPWVVPRRISVLWDINDEPLLNTFADPTALRRLLVNLITNAIRVTPEENAVLVRLERVRGGESIRWQVIDSGPGIEATRLRQISQRRLSLAEGEGIGLAISRQLAAVHFSSLHIRSRPGSGTEVSFESPACGPLSVAASWSRWRCAVASRQVTPRPLSRPPAASAPSYPSPLIGESVLTRIDPPSLAVELTHDGSEPLVRDRLIAGTVSLGPTVPVSRADRFDERLQRQQRMYDLVYRTGRRHWVWFFDTDPRHYDERVAMITDAVGGAGEGMRLHWSCPHVIPVDRRRMESRVRDWLIRQTLSASAAGFPHHRDGWVAPDEIGHSPIPEARLDQEVRRLSVQTTT